MIWGWNHKLRKTADNVVHHADTVASVLLVNIHTPILNLAVQETVQPALHTDALSVIRFRGV